MHELNLNDLLSIPMLRAGGVALTGLGIFLTTWAIAADQSGPFYRYWARYTSSLERKLRPQFIWTKGSTIAMGQGFALCALTFACVATEVPFWYVAAAVILIGPSVWIEKMRRERVEAIEKQLDNFMLSLANALKTTPSIGAAFASVALVIQDPTRQEVELAIKEMKVGSTLDQALLHMASRVGSRPMDSALSAILIGRQVGGNLPKVLEGTAATLREMARLEGVVRTKTAEGKMQLWVLGALPAALVWGLNSLWAGYFTPLTQSVVGYTILFACGGMWVSALVLARRVLNVDI
jgi:tight adherence protein B